MGPTELKRSSAGSSKTREKGARRHKCRRCFAPYHELVHGLSPRLRFRLGRSDLPGKPDLVFPSRRIALFVHGCFWHGHDCARGARMPHTNRTYWQAKIARNMERDAASLASLRKLDWKPAVIWECETKDTGKLSKTIRGFLA